VALERWDVVVLSDVARTAVSAKAMAALGSWVENRGGGLLFVGGSAVFGEGVDRPEAGYRHTEVERLLPVTFDRDDEPEVALVIVLDRSWSMNGTSMELSKSAAEAAANTLAPAQMLGVLTFNDQSEWDVPLTRVRDSKATLHAAIARITASGPTEIYTALDRAFGALTVVRARAKHVILLSDGQTEPQDFEDLVKKMSAAGITVSSVALGPDADVKLLGNLAAWGGGRSYVVHDAQEVTAIFVKEAKNASTPGADANGAIAAIAKPAAVALDGASSAPALYGRNAVTKKPQAIEMLATSHGDPLLTTWPVGLGRTAMFAADFEGRWTRDWPRWKGFGAFLSSLVRSLAPRRVPLSSLTVTGGDRQGDQRGLHLVLNVRDQDGHRENLLSPAVNVRRGDKEQVTLPLTQNGPGLYEARVVADTTTPLEFSLAGGAGTAPASAFFVDDRSAEYRLAPPDGALLSAIARMTGGAFHPTPDDIREAPRGIGVARHPLAPELLGFTLLLWPIEITLRRFRR
jgi:Ca-activated chloride channel family protein